MIPAHLRGGPGEGEDGVGLGERLVVPDVGGVAQPELAVAVVPPALHPPVRQHRAGAVLPEGDLTPGRGINCWVFLIL